MASPEFHDVLQRYLQRRQFLKTAGVIGAAATIAPLAGSVFAADKKGVQPRSLGFEEVAQGLDETLTVPSGYQAQVLLRWGDPIFSGAEEFDPYKQSEMRQMHQFGFNNDFVGFLPLPLGSNNSSHGLLVVNHEYTDPSLMFPGSPDDRLLTRAQVDIDIAAHGMSVVEIELKDGRWSPLLKSHYNRRITPHSPVRFSGPAAGHSRLHSMDCRDGVLTMGTAGNCAGGVTPWGTVLTGEENIDYFFSGDPNKTPEAELYKRFGFTPKPKSWGRHYERWNLEKNPAGALHFGWIVEVDPYDPKSVPKKRTALGHFKHEGCNIHIDKDGQVAAYMGDDQAFEYLYKFVCRDKYRDGDREHNMTLLDHGTLHVAKFLDTGELQWLPMIYGQGPLTPDKGFNSQADVCIDTRRAADLLGATPMDRPEDVEVDPVGGHVFANLTNNTHRTADQLDKANPRAKNEHGQIIEFWPESGRHADEIFRWDLFILAGKPGEGATQYHPDISANGWFSCPDNCAFDTLGNLWIATDGAEYSGANMADGLWACEVSGEARALSKRFMRIPRGAEMTGPFFAPDSKSLFCSVQHPGEHSTFDHPTTRWPDFSDKMPPRPAVVVITKKDGGRIGS